MNKKNYTPDRQHPEDAIYKVKQFISELQKVQEEYFEKLVTSLSLTEEGEEHLFDYVYNSSEDYCEDFEHYLSEFNVSYDSIVNNRKTKRSK